MLEASGAAVAADGGDIIGCFDIVGVAEEEAV
jgi:hypothetical protein